MSHPPDPPQAPAPPEAPRSQAPRASEHPGKEDPSSAAAGGFPLPPSLSGTALTSGQLANLAQIMVAAAGARPPYSGPPVLFSAPTIPVVQLQQSVQSWQGPYPPPEAVERYEEVLPGTFDRMLRMAEQLQAAQIDQSKQALDYTHSDTKRGHWLGFILGVVAVGAALASEAMGYPWLAAVFISVPLLGVARALIASARKDSTAELIREATRQLETPLKPDTKSETEN